MYSFDLKGIACESSTLYYNDFRVNKHINNNLKIRRTYYGKILF
nr:MAG TPA: hypothetical protein [Crassvirales sp.]